MKIAIGHLGGLTYALKTSLEDLGFEVILPSLNNKQMLEIGQNYLTSGLCFPLKIALGNFISVKESQPDAVIFYSGCDLCNLPPGNHIFKEILNDQGCCPEIYLCAIDSKHNFITSYFNLIKKISNKPLHKLIHSLYLAAIKYETFHFIDQVFYNIRPIFNNSHECERLYESYFNKLIQLSSVTELKKLNIELGELYKNYRSSTDTRFLRVGLIGDSYSLMEPSSHNYTDRYLGKLNVIVDRWSYKYLSPQKIHSDSNINNFKKIFKQELGVYTSLEIKKISNYINEGYDGLIFISPFNCNPNDILRNLLTRVREEFDMPILDLLIDEHDSDIGANTRIEAFIDMLHRKQLSKKHENNYSTDFRKFSIARFACDPLY